MNITDYIDGTDVIVNNDNIYTIGSAGQILVFFVQSIIVLMCLSCICWCFDLKTCCKRDKNIIGGINNNSKKKFSIEKYNSLFDIDGQTFKMLTNKKKIPKIIRKKSLWWSYKKYNNLDDVIQANDDTVNPIHPIHQIDKSSAINLVEQPDPIAINSINIVVDSANPIAQVAQVAQVSRVTPLDPIDIENNKKFIFVFEFNNLDQSKLNQLNKEKIDEFEYLETFANHIHKNCLPTKVEIILKISSPGGIAYKFEKTYSSLMRLRNKGFVITALIDDICASGGYMLACACNTIICSKYSQIGSVGVIANAYNYHELLTKVGIEEKTFKTGKYKSGFPTGEKYNEEDIIIMNETIDETLQIFKDIVQRSRNLSEEEMTHILSANVWYGEKALQYKLVDNIKNSIDYLDELNEYIIYTVSPISNNKSIVSELTDIFAINNIIEGIMTVFEYTKNRIMMNKIVKII
jgi:signal peptide peptidase SppA